MQVRKFVAKMRLGLTLTLSWMSPLQFIGIWFLFLTANYEHFASIPYWMFIVGGFVITLIPFGIFAYYSVGSIYKGEVDYFIDVLEERGYRIVRQSDIDALVKPIIEAKP